MKATAQTEQQPKAELRREPEYILPKTNIFETKDGYMVEAEMPGVSREGLEITLEGNEIAITGRRKSDAVTGRALFRECDLADYRRVFELDPVIDSSKIAAKIEQGLLTLTLPKSEKVRPRKIAVT